MNLSKVLTEKNKQIDKELRKLVSEFINKEIDIDRLKKDVIYYYSNHINKINYRCASLVTNFLLHLKKDEIATLFINNSEFKKYMSKDIEATLNISGLGNFKVSTLDIRYYDYLSKEVEFTITLELLEYDF